MKHIFDVCTDASESLGLEKILNFYNVVALENSDSVEDIKIAGGNVIVTKDFSSKEFTDYVKNFSYNEKPFVISSVQDITIKLSQLYDWDIRGVKPSSATISGSNNSIMFSVYKRGNEKIFGNIHKYLIKDYKEYILEVLDWSVDLIQDVQKLVEEMKNLSDGYNTVEASLEDGNLVVKNVIAQSLPYGINTFTRAQIIDQKTPFVMYEIYDDVTKEDKLSFHEDYTPSNPVSQDKPYNITRLNIKTKYESVIKNDFATGIWKYGGDNTGKIEKNCIAIYEIDEEGDKTLCLLHRGFSLYDVIGQEGFVICTRQKNTVLKAGDVLASFRVPSTVLTNENELIGWTLEVVSAILNFQMK